MVEAGESSEGGGKGLHRGLTKKHFLALVFELGRVRRDLAFKKIGISPEVGKAWISELESEGWIRVSGDELGEPLLEVTPKALDRQKDIVRMLEEHERDVAEDAKPKYTVKQKFGRFADTSKRSFTSVIVSFFMNLRDILIIASTLLSLYLLYNFILSPNTAILNFLLGAILLALVLILYRQYEKYLKTRSFISFVEWVMLLINMRRKHIAVIITLVFLIYIAGLMMLDPDDTGIYLMGCMVVLTTGLLISYPKKSIADALKFYVGMAQLMYSMLLIVGMLSITDPILVSKSRTIDVVVGILFLIILQLNEEFFGVGPTEFKKMTEL
ncbi:MAG: hypothetical protein ABIH11_09345 [Candidatus Altiarchaeota archaeon]